MSKGRNKNLIKKRNEALIRRYYYWTEVRRRRFDDVLKILSEEEFFLSEERILSIIREPETGMKRQCAGSSVATPPYAPYYGKTAKPVPLSRFFVHDTFISAFIHLYYARQAVPS